MPHTSPIDVLPLRGLFVAFLGLVRTRRTPAALAVALTFTTVILLIADLDRPGDGGLEVSQQALIDLQQTMKAPGQ